MGKGFRRWVAFLTNALPLFSQAWRPWAAVGQSNAEVWACDVALLFRLLQSLLDRTAALCRSGDHESESDRKVAHATPQPSYRMRGCASHEITDPESKRWLCCRMGASWAPQHRTDLATASALLSAANRYQERSRNPCSGAHPRAPDLLAARPRQGLQGWRGLRPQEPLTTMPVGKQVDLGCARTRPRFRHVHVTAQLARGVNIANLWRPKRWLRLSMMDQSPDGRRHFRHFAPHPTPQLSDVCSITPKTRLGTVSRISAASRLLFRMILCRPPLWSSTVTLICFLVGGNTYKRPASDQTRLLSRSVDAVEALQSPRHHKYSRRPTSGNRSPTLEATGDCAATRHTP